MTTGGTTHTERSTTKRAPATAAQRAVAVALVDEQGLAAAHRQLGIAKATLSRWAKAAGIDSAGRHRTRTEAAVAATHERAATAATSTVAVLEAQLEQAGEYLAAVMGANNRAARLIINVDPDLIVTHFNEFGPYQIVEDQAVQDAQKIAAVLASLPLQLRDVVGLHTRAIHDLALLNGEATERGDIVVQFAIPRPHPGDTVIIEQTALGQP